MKYCDKILKQPSRRSTHITEGKLEILRTNHKSEEIVHLYPIFFCAFEQFCCDFLKRKCLRFSFTSFTSSQSMFDW